MVHRALSSVVLVLLWDYLMHAQDLMLYFLFSGFHEVNVPQTPIHKYGNIIVVSLAFFSFPLFGLLADVWIGRYKAILIGIVLCFISWIIGGIGLLMYRFYSYKTLLGIFYFIGGIVQAFGYSSFRANIIQYNIDQFVGASADELSTIIYWHCISVPIIELFFYLVECFFINYNYLFIMNFIASGVFVSLVVVSHSFFKHKLENISLIKNPIKLIVRVLCYARKHKYPENRSALTYWEEEAPSRLDLGKNKYGGPFTEEEVEDVKTASRIILPLMLCVCAYACTDNRYWSYSNNSLTQCIIFTRFPFNMSCLCLILVYLFFIRIFFYKYIPSMLTRISVGIFLAFAVSVVKLIIYSPVQLIYGSSFIDYEMIVPQILHGFSFILFFPVSLEFTVAQSPVHMRGVMVGLWYASWGIGYLISAMLKFPFNCESQYVCTSFYYYITKSVLVLIILIVFVILAKCYKYRVRENEVNIVQIVDDHYQRYMEQEEQYNKDRNNDIHY